MTPSTTPPGRPTPPAQPGLPTDEELEARLAASWQRGVARAEDDLARTDLVAVALTGGRRRRAWRSGGAALLGVAGVLLAGAAIIVGGGGLREAREPLPSARAIASIGPAITPEPTPYESGSPGPSVEPTPVPVGDPSEGIPYIEPEIPFPASVDGRPVLAVGGGAEEALSASTDNSPIYLTGWMVGTDRTACTEGDLGSPAPNGVRWKDCEALALRATADGGATLRVHFDYDSLDRLLRGPGATMAMEVLLQVHSHDPGCAADDCRHKAVYDAVVQYRVPRIAPAVLAATMPPGGITSVEAIAVADAYLVHNPSGYSESWILLRAEVGSRLIVGATGGETNEGWVWAVWYVSPDGYFETTVDVGYLDGSANQSSGGNLRFP